VVVVRDATEETVGSAVTDNRGFFRIETPVPGRYVLSAQALGYTELPAQPLEVPYGKLAVVEVQLAPAALELEPLVVTAAPRAFHLEADGFYARRDNAAHAGVFLPPEVLEERRPTRATDLLFGIPGLYVMESQFGAGGRAPYFRSGIRPDPTSPTGITICWPMVYVDRVPVQTGGLLYEGAGPGEMMTLDEFLDTTDIAAIEVYRGAAEVPAEFTGANSGCGVIVVWTHRGGGR
jgi:hypothetical protein